MRSIVTEREALTSMLRCCDEAYWLEVIYQHFKTIQFIQCSWSFQINWNIVCLKLNTEGYHRLQ